MQHHRVIQQLPNCLSCSLSCACGYWQHPAEAAQCILHNRHTLALAVMLLPDVGSEWRSQDQPYPHTESSSE